MYLVNGLPVDGYTFQVLTECEKRHYNPWAKENTRYCVPDPLWTREEQSTSELRNALTHVVEEKCLE